MGKEAVKQAKSTKAEKITSLLLRSNGATLSEIAKNVDWQEHSVRGFISGTLKKKQGIHIISKQEADKPRRYFIERGAK